MRLIRLHKAGPARFKNHFARRIDDLITQSPFKQPDNAPYTGLGAMFLTQSGGQGILIEYGVRLYGSTADAFMKISHLGIHQLAR